MKTTSPSVRNRAVCSYRHLHIGTFEAPRGVRQVNAAGQVYHFVKVAKSIVTVLQAQNMSRTWAEHVLPMFCACSFHGNFKNNLLSYCGLVDTTISVTEKNYLYQSELSRFFANYRYMLEQVF